MLIALIYGITQSETKLAFTRGQIQLFGLLRVHLQSDATDGVSLALVFRLVEVLTAGQNLDVLQDDLGDRPLRGIIRRSDNYQDINQRPRHQESGDPDYVIHSYRHRAIPFGNDRRKPSGRAWRSQPGVCYRFARSDSGHGNAAHDFLNRIECPFGYSVARKLNRGQLFGNDLRAER